jgi:uncharacterized membrane protein
LPASGSARGRRCSRRWPESWAQGAQALNQIRQRVTTNLLLGALVVALASLGLAF